MMIEPADIAGRLSNTHCDDHFFKIDIFIDERIS
jgi:hypothetical protein